MISAGDLGWVLVTVAVVYLPGALVLLAAGARSVPAWIGLAPLVTVGVALLTACLTGLTALPFGPLSVGVVLVVVAAAAGVLHRRRPPPGSASIQPPQRPPLAVAGVGIAATVAAVGLATWSWLSGLGGLATLPVEHDTVLHTTLVAYIYRSGVAAPWRLIPADVASGEPVSFYPAGLHSLAALIADLGTDPVTAFNAVTVVLFGVCWPVGLAVAGMHVLPRPGRLTAAAPLLAGAAAVVGATLYRPAVALAHDGGILANAAALALVPALIAALVHLPRSWLRRVVVGLAAAGALAVHPTAALTVALSLAAWLVGDCVTSTGRARLRRFARRVWPAAFTAAVLGAPELVGALSVSGYVGSYPRDVAAAPVGRAAWNTVSMVYSYFFDPGLHRRQLVAAVLVLLGVLVALVVRTGTGAVAAWLLWVAMTTALNVDPAGPPVVSTVIGFYYNSWVRIIAHVSVFAPLVAGLGVVGVAAAAQRLARAAPGAPRWTELAAPAAALLVLAGYLAAAGVNYVRTNAQALAERYAAPQFVRVDTDDQAAFRYLAAHVRPGERVMNSPNDGSTYLYTEYGVPVVNVSTLGFPLIPSSYRLMAGFNRLGHDGEVDGRVRGLDIAWVYVDTQAPPIESSGAPSGWAGPRLSVPAGLQHLDRVAGLRLAFQAGSVHVYRVDPALLSQSADPTP